jgi:hypothetical protein
MAHSWPVQASLGFAALLLFQPFSPRNVFAVRAAPPSAASSSVAPAMGSVCRFTSGPKAGTTRDFAPMLAAVGSPCSDGAGSRGKVERSDKPAALATTPVSQQMGTVCAFTAGPKAGTSHDYAPMKAPLGMDCSDGAGSHGIIVLTAPAAAVPAVQTLASESAAAPGGQSPQTGTVCKFTSGPKAGTERDYAPMHAPLNTACDDGAGSSGIIIAAVQTGSVCKFTSGPKAGTEQDYAPMHAPLNTVCEDGAGSSGVIVKAPQMGSVCKFTAGPKAGTEHDYAPMHEPVNTTCDDGAGSSGVIVAAQQEGTICRFNAGPRAGSQQDYAPVHAPLNTACSDGAGSSGIIVAAAAAPASPAAMAAAAQPPAASAPGPHPVSSGSPSGAAAPTPASAGGNSPAADTAANASGLQGPAAAPHSRVQLGSVCKITSGPKAGSTYDFAPMRADVGALCNYGPDNTGVIIASPSKPAKTGPPRVYSVP